MGSKDSPNVKTTQQKKYYCRKKALQMYTTKPLLPQFIRSFSTSDLEKLNMDISRCINLSRKEVVRMHLKNSRHFNEIEHLFKDIPLNSFSDKKKELNNWTLRELLLLVDQMDTSVSAMKGSEFQWEKIDSPRDGGEETWKKIVDNLPKTFDESLKRVKMHVVSRVMRPARCKEMQKEALWGKYIWINKALRKELEQKGVLFKLHPRNYFEAMSPLGRLLMCEKGMLGIASDYAEKYNQLEREGLAQLQERKVVGKFAGNAFDDLKD